MLSDNISLHQMLASLTGDGKGRCRWRVVVVRGWAQMEAMATAALRPVAVAAPRRPHRPHRLTAAASLCAHHRPRPPAQPRPPTRSPAHTPRASVMVRPVVEEEAWRRQLRQTAGGMPPCWHGGRTKREPTQIPRLPIKGRQAELGRAN